MFNIVVWVMSSKECDPAPISQVLRVLQLMPQVITWLRESSAWSCAYMALGLVRGCYKHTNVN